MKTKIRRSWTVAVCVLALGACSDDNSGPSDSQGGGDGQVEDSGPAGPDAGPPVQGWAKRLGDSANEQGNALAVDASGNIYVTGTFGGTIDFGDGAKTSAGSDDVFVASYKPTGELRWAKQIGGTGTDKGNAVAVDDKGNLFVTGQFRDSVDFGSGAKQASGNSDVFVLGMSGDSGAINWAEPFGGDDNDYGLGIVVDAKGNVTVTGEFGKTMTVGGETLTSNGRIDLFVASFQADGTPRWAKGHGGTDDEHGYGIAVDAKGDVYVTGYYFGKSMLGGASQPNRGGADALLASYGGADGAHRWSTSFGGTQNDRGTSLAVHGDSLYLTGRFIGNVDFGQGPIAGVDGFDIMLASFKTTDGTVNWSKPFGDVGNDFGMDLATDGTGNVYLAGGFAKTVDFGDGAKTSAGQNDTIAAAYAADGSPLWSKRFGGAQYDQANGIAVSATGNVCLTGYAEDEADLGQGKVPGLGGKDLFLIQLKP